MCKGGGALGFDRASRGERWGVATDEALQAAVKTPGLVWLDVRTDAEIAKKPLPAGLGVKICNVTMFSTKDLEKQAPSLLPEKDAPMLIFCSGGGRADEARKCLQKMGYTGTITNGGMPEDIQGAVGDLEALVPKKKKGGCHIS